jgi:hypothetical protein
MIRPKIAMGFVCGLLALVLHIVPGAVGPAHAQGTRKDDIVFNSRGIPLAGATVRVCAMPASGQPCTPLALIYSDAALTQALANPTTTDGLGNYFFYAAPGKYEIEISGPAITTKQIPNVILPNDPASPTFSGAVSAFSLTLSGNLTVSGNTTVVGNLASGTLNLANQITPPGSASSGTVNLYTKTADKRLYYKDDTGAEVGPLGAGAQTNAVNTFTANQNLDSGLHIKGPDPYNDLARYGAYFNTSPPSTTASCTNASTSVTLAAALDFQDASKFPGTNVGNGIVLYQCGAATGLTTPPAPTVTPFGVTNGTTTYNYRFVAEDLQGGLTAASTAGSTTTGAATLGTNSITLTNATWNNTLNGEQVYTCSANCNLSVNAPVNIAGFTGNARFNGNFTVIATPTASTFTVYSPSATTPAVTSDSSGGTMKVLACNILSMGSGVVPNTVEGASSDTVMRWWVYRNNVLAFVVQARDPYYEDCGVTMPVGNIPSYVPSSPSASPVNKYLATTIVSGGGTTSIVVASAAGNTVSGQTAMHDNSQNLLACMNASKFSTPCYVPVAANPPFNAATVFTFSNSNSGHLLTSIDIGVNQPWVVRASGVVFEGQRGFGVTQFQFLNLRYLTGAGNGSAYPAMLLLPLNNGSGSAGNQQTSTGVQFINFGFQTQPVQSIPFVEDQAFMFGLIMNNTGFVAPNSAANLNVPAAVIKGPTHSVIGASGNENSCIVFQTILNAPCIRFTTQSVAATTSTISVIAQSEVRGWNLLGNGFQFDTLPWINSGGSVNNITGMFNVTMEKFLGEQRFGPFIRFAMSGPSQSLKLSQVDDDAPSATQGNGLIDTAYSGEQAPNFIVDSISSSVNSQVLVSGPGNVSGSSGLAYGTTLGPTNPAGSIGGAIASGNTGIRATDIAFLGYGVTVPNTPTVVLGASGSCGSNCVAAGTYVYGIVANDIYGHNTLMAGCSSPATVSGTQTVTVGWVPVDGQVTTQRFRSASTCANALGADNSGTGQAGTSYIDGTSGPASPFGNGYGLSQPTSANFSASSVGSQGVAGPQLTLTNSNFKNVISGTLTANRTQTIPDVTGYIPVTSYVNSAYDNATRANGAIGANWTIQQNGLNIAANQIQGTTASQSNTGFWNANTFSPVQFAQATVTALNGATDFPGVTVLASGTGASATYYDCVENSTTIFLQRVVNAGTTNLTSTASTGSVGDFLRLEIAPGGTLTCFKNGSVALTATDTQIASGSPGLLISGSVATEKNWSGGNLHPLAQLDSEQDWTKTQHFTQGVAFGTEIFTASPRAEQNLFLPGALTSTWTGATWTVDKAVTITRIQVQAKTAPAGCTTNAIVRFTDGTTPLNVTISAAANDSGAISQNYAAGSSLQVSVQTAAAGCTTSPADANATVQYRMQ